MITPKPMSSLEGIVYPFFLLVFASGNGILKIIFSLLLLAFLIVQYHYSKFFFNLLENNRPFFKAQPKEFSTISIAIVFRITLVLIFLYFLWDIFKTRGEYNYLSEILFVVFPVLFHVVTHKIKKAKGYYYFFESGVFLPSNHNEIIEWDEIEKFGNNPEKDHFEFYLRNQDKFYVKKGNPGYNEIAGDEEFIESLLGFVSSKLKPKQIQS